MYRSRWLGIQFGCLLGAVLLTKCYRNLDAAKKFHLWRHVARSDANSWCGSVKGLPAGGACGERGRKEDANKGVIRDARLRAGGTWDAGLLTAKGGAPLDASQYTLLRPRRAARGPGSERSERNDGEVSKCSAFTVRAEASM